MKEILERMILSSSFLIVVPFSFLDLLRDTPRRIPINVVAAVTSTPTRTSTPTATPTITPTMDNPA